MKCPKDANEAEVDDMCRKYRDDTDHTIICTRKMDHKGKHHSHTHTRFCNGVWDIDKSESPINPAEHCYCGAYLGFKGFCSKECHDENYDTITNSEHYAGSVEPLDLIIAQGLGFCSGNIVKYVCRWKKKGGTDDLKKALWYLERLLKEEDK